MTIAQYKATKFPELNNTSDVQAEAVRQLTVCNACRYCEGICAVFPAMQLRRKLTASDADYLSSLCHSCGACYYDCQYAPPHEFSVNVPAIMRELREETYARHAWPGFMAPVYRNNGVKIAVLSAISVALFLLGFILLTNPQVLMATGSEEGAFYRAMPHNVMAGLFGGVFVFAIIATALSVRRFWQSTESGGTLSWAGFWSAAKDAGQLRYLDGGGMGCMHASDTPSKSRKRYHHFTMYGFLLCLASTTCATFMHYVLGVEAPYPYLSPTVILGTLGGLGLIIGPIGLLRSKKETDQALVAKKSSGMDVAFLYMLLFTSLTGLVLMLLRASSMMGILLAIHLGVVFALFLTMPYGKFIHGFYRYAALIRYAYERRNIG